MGTQVITRDTGRRLGVVGEVVVDIDRREVVALGLRDNPLTRYLPGLPKWMILDRIRQVGDVILVDSIDSLSEDFNPDRYSKVINCQVITESGEQLGRVLGFSFDIETGELISLVMGALGVPLLGEGVLSTWEIPVNEIVSSGADRIIVYEGAEEKLKQLSSGLLEKIGVGGAAWDERENERYRVNLVPVENQLTSGEEIQENQRALKASEDLALPEEEQELEYVELEDQNQYYEKKSRYLEDINPPKSTDFGNSYVRNNDQFDFSQGNNFSNNIPESKSNLSRLNNGNTRKSLINSDDPLDIEPIKLERIDRQSIDSEEEATNNLEIEDPW
ncbi:Protein implicated in RNA metabolism (PRC-barrel domain) [Prochlorococcus sp. MIT 0602]|nr:Protein implicated in RNA metabolism (PRC-barrel domain) [Prochlorococcus sp. MIT 0602]KGG18143.1 Protein implicated in RNA metabolism (PRC-barrel domain) [Prochlorococcus sp. MIT 0603]